MSPNVKNLKSSRVPPVLKLCCDSGSGLVRCSLLAGYFSLEVRWLQVQERALVSTAIQPFFTLESERFWPEILQSDIQDEL